MSARSALEASKGRVRCGLVAYLNGLRRELGRPRLSGDEARTRSLEDLGREMTGLEREIDEKRGRLFGRGGPEKKDDGNS